MVFQMVLYQLLAISCVQAARKIMRGYIEGGFHLSRNHKSLPQPASPGSLIPSITRCDLHNRATSLVCDIDGVLLRSESFFPYFMLVAFEGGSILRAFLLLLLSPFLWMFNYQVQLRVMIFVTFCGLRKKDMESVGRAVLPKFYLENLNLDAYKVWAAAGGLRVVFTSVPRVMVETFLKEYLNVDVVVGTELQSVVNLYTGFLSASGLAVKHRALKEYFGDKKPDIGLGSCSTLHVHQDHLFLSLCKEAYVVNNSNSHSSIMPRNMYPKPLIFHDGRLAFLPTPSATLCMFLWIPLGIILAVFRISIGVFLPYKLAMFLGTLSGVDIRLDAQNLINATATTTMSRRTKGVLYVCTHRTLLDPVFLSTSLSKPLTAVTYSLSRMSEIIAPIKTVRLTRDRKRDGETMERLLSQGDLVVCPEGTTCREPYLLRFSSLFAELADEIVPVAINTQVTMFYGTTARGLKCLDPIFFFMNPKPSCHIRILGKVPKEQTCAGGKSSFEVANYIQKQLADALGFECTSLTRKDKYMMLAGNDGVVKNNNNNNNNNKRSSFPLPLN